MQEKNYVMYATYIMLVIKVMLYNAGNVGNAVLLVMQSMLVMQVILSNFPTMLYAFLQMTPPQNNHAHVAT